MKSIYINRNPVYSAWGGGNSFVRTIHDSASSYGFDVATVQKSRLVDQVVIDPNNVSRLWASVYPPDCDYFFCIDPRQGDMPNGEVHFQKERFENAKVVYRVNECDQRKGDVEIVDPEVRKMIEQSDLIVFISEWVRDYHMLGSKSRPPCKFKSTARVEVIRNGHLSIFKPGNKRNDGKCHIVTHHWSPNVMKGADIYASLAKWVLGREDFTFTYIGRTSYEIPGANLPNSNVRVLPPVWGKELANLLGTYDCYVSGSRFDPGPNHIAEALGCELPTWVHRDGGGGVEMAGEDHVYESFDQLREILESGKWKEPNTTISQPWEKVIDRYFTVIKEI